jgi:outer membrane protein assembly factor BamB
MRTRHYSPLNFLFYPFVLIVLGLGIQQIYKKNPSLLDHYSLLENKKKVMGESVLNIQVDRSELTKESLNLISQEGMTAGRTQSNPQNVRTLIRFTKDGQSFGENLGALLNGSWSLHQKGILLASSNMIAFLNYQKAPIWEFIVSESESLSHGKLVLTEDLVFATTMSGKTYALDTQSGNLRWLRERKGLINAQPTFVGGKIITLLEEGNNFDIEIVDPSTGKTLKEHSIGKVELSGLPSFDKDASIMILQTLTGGLSVINLETGKVTWSYEHPTGLRGSALIIGNRSFSVSEDGTVFCKDLKNGKEIWSYSVDQKVSAGLAAAAEINMGFVIDDESYLHAIDLNEGKRKWRIGLKTPQKQRALLAAKANSEQIKKLQIPDGSQDWVIWAVTSDNTLSAYDPKSGIQLIRLKLGAQPLSGPMWYPDGQSLWIPRKDGQKGGQFIVYGTLPSPTEEANTNTDTNSMPVSPEPTLLLSPSPSEPPATSSGSN